jgi:hypothetical protein
VTARMRTVSGLAVAISVAAFAYGCTAKELPMAPSDPFTGIIVYEHANFLGNSAHMTSDIPDLRDFRGPCVHESDDGADRNWNDCISSVRVAPGWRATLYRGPNYRDDALDITEDVPNLQLVRQHDCPKDGLNDCVSSVRVRKQ